VPAAEARATDWVAQMAANPQMGLDEMRDGNASLDVLVQREIPMGRATTFLGGVTGRSAGQRLWRSNPADRVGGGR